MITPMKTHVSQRGVALVTSLLLLLIITILAVSMFRSFGTQERIAGNVREKERALHAANSAVQYAEWWLLNANNTAIGASDCSAAVTVVASATAGLICDQTPMKQWGDTQAAWSALTLQGGNTVWTPQVTFTPDNMLLVNPSGATYAQAPYFLSPAFWITYLNTAADGAGQAYQIDAYGYGSSQSTVAVVETTYEIQQGVVNRGSL